MVIQQFIMLRPSLILQEQQFIVIFCDAVSICHLCKTACWTLQHYQCDKSLVGIHENKVNAKIHNKTLHTNKCWHSPPLLAGIITTAGPHFKSGLRQWSEPRLSCDDGGSARPIHNTLIVATLFLVPETNLILSDTVSWVSSIGWWVPVQCYCRLVCVYRCCQV